MESLSGEGEGCGQATCRVSGWKEALRDRL